MTAFLIGAALLAAIGLGLLLWPLESLRRRDAVAPASSRRQLNAAIYRDQMAELDADRTEGDLDEADWQQARQELQRRILDDGADSPPTHPSPPSAEGASSAQSGQRGLMISLAVAIPIAAALLYLLLGNPSGLDPAPHAQMPSMEEIEKMVTARLEKEPDNPQALWLAGMMAFERENFADAIRFWERLLKHLPPDSEDAQSVTRSLDEARSRAISMKGSG